jgi:hypothetical protein
MNTSHRASAPLALSGSILAFLPIVAPVILGTVMLFVRSQFLFDWLMPGELFLLELAAAVMLLTSALISKRRRAWIAWSAGIAVIALPLTQLAATLTGLAHGDTEPGGWESTIVLIIYSIYVMALLVMIAGGIRLYADLRRDSSKREIS